MTIIIDSMISHHAVLFSSNSPLTVSIEGIATVPESGQYRLPQLVIKDVRQIIDDSYRRPDSESDERVLLVATEFVTEEAQQALLKIIEEPPLSTRFIFVIPVGYSLLPTLESRFERMGMLGETTDSTAFKAFQGASYSERLAQIELSTKSKNTAWQVDVKRGLIEFLKQPSIKLSVAQLRELEYIVRLLLTRGASNKFLLEHLALVLPA